MGYLSLHPGAFPAPTLHKLQTSRVMAQSISALCKDYVNLTIEEPNLYIYHKLNTPKGQDLKVNAKVKSDVLYKQIKARYKGQKDG